MKQSRYPGKRGTVVEAERGGLVIKFGKGHVAIGEDLHTFASGIVGRDVIVTLHKQPGSEPVIATLAMA